MDYNIKRDAQNAKSYINMTGDFKINGKDAYTTWGMGLEDGGVSILLTPPAQKERVQNKSRLEHGARILTTNEKKDERDLTITVHFSARNKTEFWQRYNSFCEELALGTLNIEIIQAPGIVYKCLYESCQQFKQWDGRLAKYILKLTEPNPADRSSTT